MNDGNSMRPVADVLGDLNEMIWDAFPKEWLKAYDRRRYKAEALAKIKRNSLPWMEGGFRTSAWMRVDCKESLWPPRWSWLAVYTVTGTSEGHYVHIDLIGCPGDSQVEHMAMVKTFSGWDKASLIAQAAGRLLGA